MFFFVLSFLNMSTKKMFSLGRKPYKERDFGVFLRNYDDHISVFDNKVYLRFNKNFLSRS